MTCRSSTHSAWVLLKIEHSKANNKNKNTMGKVRVFIVSRETQAKHKVFYATTIHSKKIIS